MTQEPHPQRCETCRDIECQFHNKNILNWKTPEQSGLRRAIVEVIRSIGCASHSSAASGRLEKFAISMSNSIGALESLEPDKYSENWYEIQVLKKWLRELRKQGNPDCKETG